MAFDLNTIVMLLIALAIIGGLVWAADKYLPIPQPIKGIVLFIIIALGLLWLADKVGVL